MKSFIAGFLTCYLMAASISTFEDYYIFGMKFSTSVLWGSFWGPRHVCRSFNARCSTLPWGIVPETWVFNMRPEVLERIRH